MANRRMFALEITNSDAFADMPLSTQALYFHLGMATDDDGFVVSPKRIQRAIGASGDDMRILVSKGFIIPFPSGVIVVAHHLVNNTLRNDRHKRTNCCDEFDQVTVLQSNAYCLKSDAAPLPSVQQDPVCQPADNQVATERQPADSRPATEGMPNITKQSATKPNPTEPSSNPKSGANAPAACEVVRYLNDRIGTSFKADSKRTVELIDERVSEGFSFQDFQHVIDVKAAQWGSDPTMSRYLRPETLFGDKFESYVNEREVICDEYPEYNC